MKHTKTLYILNFALILLLLSAASCSRERQIDFPRTDLSTVSLIPKPLTIISDYSGFALDKYTAIVVEEDDVEFKEVGIFLADRILKKTGLSVPMLPGKDTETIISISQSSLELDSPEAYRLKITQDTLFLTANTAEGAFRGVQTIRQLIPEQGDETLAKNKVWVVPTGVISDAPQFSYRGSMLDVCRHFFDMETVKKYIDLMTYYKMNILHMHISDDQGWRIEIKSWPKLTEIGGSTQVGGGPGGYYTQEEFKDLVEYAAANYITIVPEIDMPGHTNSASASYPFLNGNGKKAELYIGRDVGFSTFDTHKDTVYAFIDDVIREVSSLTPGPYFHIGGDESHSTKEEDYIYFINKVEKIVHKYGKIMVGWDEISHADLSSTSVAQWWKYEENKDLAIKKGMKLIISPANKIYIDMKYDTLTKVGYNWAGYIPVDTGYMWNPESYAPIESILGVEAPLWSETISQPDSLEYLAFPRLIGAAELGWTIQGNRDWNDYKERLADQAPFLERNDVHFYRSQLIDWKSIVPE